MSFIIHELAALYLILTFAATALAKAKTFQSTYFAIANERIVPVGLAPTVLRIVIAAELGLSLLIVFRIAPQVVGIVIAAVFAIFAAYKLVSAKKTGIASCSCAGPQTVYKATTAGIIASIAASLVQACIGLLYSTLSSNANAASIAISVAAFAAPVTIFTVSQIRTRRGTTTPIPM